MCMRRLHSSGDADIPTNLVGTSRYGSASAAPLYSCMLCSASANAALFAFYDCTGAGGWPEHDGRPARGTKAAPRPRLLRCSRCRNGRWRHDVRHNVWWCRKRTGDGADGVELELGPVWQGQPSQWLVGEQLRGRTERWRLRSLSDVCCRRHLVCLRSDERGRREGVENMAGVQQCDGHPPAFTGMESDSEGIIILFWIYIRVLHTVHGCDI